MPILTATDPPRKRRVPVWAPILAVVLLPLFGVFGWSCYQSVNFLVDGQTISFGRTTQPMGVGYWQMGPDQGWDLKLPGGRATGWYRVQLEGW